MLGKKVSEAINDTYVQGSEEMNLQIITMLHLYPPHAKLLLVLYNWKNTKHHLQSIDILRKQVNVF
jgi:hypothetical protein